MVQWAEEKCTAASVPILMHPDSRSIKDLLEEVFFELDPSSDSAPLDEAPAPLSTPRKGQRKPRGDEIEEVAEFLRTHLFVKVSHLRALTEEDWDKLSRQKIPYRVVKMLQSKVCQIAKCLKCIDYNVIISTSAIQQFCKSKEDVLRQSTSQSQSDATSRPTSSKDPSASSATAKEQKVKVVKIDKDGGMVLFSKFQLKQGDKISIGTGTQKDTPFVVMSVTSAPGSAWHYFVTKEVSGDSRAAAPFKKQAFFPFDMVSQQKQKDAGATPSGSGDVKKSETSKPANASDGAAGVGGPLPAQEEKQAMRSPRQQLETSLPSPRQSGAQSTASGTTADAVSSSVALKRRNQPKAKVTVSFDDKMLNSTLRVALQFLCDITCKNNKFLDYQRLFTTELTLKYLIQVVEILGTSEKLLHQEIATLAVKCPTPPLPPLLCFMLMFVIMMFF